MNRDFRAKGGRVPGEDLHINRFTNEGKGVAGSDAFARCTLTISLA